MRNARPAGLLHRTTLVGAAAALGLAGAVLPAESRAQGKPPGPPEAGRVGSGGGTAGTAAGAGTAATAGAPGATGAASTTAGAERDALMQSALSAAPPTLRDTVKVVDLEGRVLRDGPGDFTCLPAPKGFAGPMCLDGQWMGWLDALTGKRAPNVTRIGLAYMLAGDSPDGGASNINPADTAPTADNDWMVEGPHVMIIVPDPAMLAGIPAEHHGGGPYVMWKGTPYAHVMMPIGERLPQRRVAGR